MKKILLDLNNPIFQEDLFALQKQEALAVLKTLKKISQLTWEQLYQDSGLKWKIIYSKLGKKGENLSSFIITKKCRGIGVRDRCTQTTIQLINDKNFDLRCIAEKRIVLTQDLRARSPFVTHKHY